LSHLSNPNDSFGSESKFMTKLTAVIINFNSGEYIFKCIDALSKQVGVSVEIIVVDNNSTDGSLDALRALHERKKIKYVYLSENVGASAANNIGINMCNHDFVLVINADVFLDSEYCQKVIAEFQDASIASCQGLLLSEKDGATVDSTGVEFFAEGVAIDRGFGDKLSGAHKVGGFTDGVCCAAAVYRVDALRDCSLDGMIFDEAYFAFYEDFELSYRMACRGYRAKFAPSALAYHVRGGSTKTVTQFVRFLALRNLSLFNLCTWRRKNIVGKILTIVYFGSKIILGNVRITRDVLLDIINKQEKIKRRAEMYGDRRMLVVTPRRSYIRQRCKKFVARVVCRR